MSCERTKRLKEAGEGWGLWSKILLEKDVLARVLRGLGVYWMTAAERGWWGVIG